MMFRKTLLKSSEA